MRLPLLTAGLAALSIALARPALAEEADCGLLCQLNGYLASDHMAGTPGDAAGGSGAAAKPRRTHAAARKAATRPVAQAAPFAAKPVAVAASKPHPATLAAARPRPEATAAAKLPMAVPDRARTAVRTVAPAPKVYSAVAAVARTTPEPAVSSEIPRPKPATPAPAKAASAVRPRRIAAVSPAASPGTTVDTPAIPGSAPAMSAAFQPFASR